MPSARFSSKVVAVLFVFALLLVTVQLAFTAVGTTAGAHWGDPVTVATTSGSVTSLSTAGGDDGAVVAWIVDTGDRWRVEVANVSLDGGSATVESPRTVASSSTELDGVDVAVDGNRRAIVWKVHDTNRIRLRTEGRTRTISSALRTRSPSVAFVDGRPVSAWIAYRNASFDLRTTSGGTKRWIAADPGGVGSPTVVGGPNGGRIVWREGSNWTAETIPLNVDDAGHVSLGKRRSLGEAYAAGGFGTSVAGAIDAAGSNGRVRAVWTNQRIVTAATVEGRNATDPVTFGPGQQPRIAARDDQWIAAWLIETKNRGYDLQYRTNGGTTERAVSLPGNSLYPSPVFGPSAGLVWTENTGSHTDVLVSAYRPHETASVIRRLGSSPERLGFVTLAASVVGAVTLPMMPWVDASFVGAFLLTTRYRVRVPLRRRRSHRRDVSRGTPSARHGSAVVGLDRGFRRRRDRSPESGAPRHERHRVRSPARRERYRRRRRGVRAHLDTGVDVGILEAHRTVRLRPDGRPLGDRAPGIPLATFKPPSG